MREQTKEETGKGLEMEAERRLGRNQQVHYCFQAGMGGGTCRGVSSYAAAVQQRLLPKCAATDAPRLPVQCGLWCARRLETQTHARVPLDRTPQTAGHAWRAATQLAGNREIRLSDPLTRHVQTKGEKIGRSIGANGSKCYN